MKKRIFLLVLLTIVLTVGVFAQTHWLSAEVSVLGGGARYEYVISPRFTVGGSIYFNFMPTPYMSSKFSMYHTIFGLDIVARWYPTGHKFFWELGLGYNSFTSYRKEEVINNYYGGYSSIEDTVADEFSGFSITPGFGWTIDIGRRGGFFISPGVKAPFTLTSENRDIMGLGGILVTGVIYFGLGYAF